MWPTTGRRPASVGSSRGGGGAAAASFSAYRSRALSTLVLSRLSRAPSSRFFSAVAVASSAYRPEMRPPLRPRYRSRRDWRSRGVETEASSVSNASQRSSRSSTASGLGGGTGRRTGGLRLRGEDRERVRLARGEVGQHLAIERHASGLEAPDERAVRQAVLARGGVDAHDPQPAEVALLAAPADEGVLERRVDRLLGRSIQLALGLEEAFRPGKDLLALGAADGSTFDSRHDSLGAGTPGVPAEDARSLFVRQHPFELHLIAVRDQRDLAQAALPLGALARQDVALERLRAQEFARRGALEALGRATMALQLRHVRVPFPRPFGPSQAQRQGLPRLLSARRRVVGLRLRGPVARRVVHVPRPGGRHRGRRRPLAALLRHLRL